MNRSNLARLLAGLFAVVNPALSTRPLLYLGAQAVEAIILQAVNNGQADAVIAAHTDAPAPPPAPPVA